MKRNFLILLFTLFVWFSGFATEINDTLKAITPDSITNVETKEDIALDKVNDVAKIDTVKTDTLKDEKFKPDPVKAIWLGAIIPGYGQIANKKYWKLPIVYGGFLGFAYAISLNNTRYNEYKNAYRDITDSDPATNSFIDILPSGYEYIPAGGVQQDLNKVGISYTRLSTLLNTYQEAYHRYRDLSIILSVGYYALVLLEAYVDAHLYNFDISPDLTLNVFPSRIQFEHSNSRSAYGLQCSIRF